MKTKIFKIITLSAAVFALGAAALSNQFNKEAEGVYAVAHPDNYADYPYSGSYYSSISSNLTEGLNGTLRKSLSSLILPKAWYTYSGSSNGTLGKILQSADEDPTNKSNMVLFYTRDSVTKQGSSNNGWNREHVWPRALSNGHWKDSNGNGKEYAGTDLLHIRPTYTTTNSARGSTRYGDNNHKGVQKYEGMEYAYTSGGYFEPIDSVKGDIARILMYVYTAYVEYYNDSSLVPTKAIESYDVLLKWHTMDKPDALEGHRNDFSESSNQKNRNPFVDHPEYAWKIFGECASASVTNECKQVYPEAGSVTPGPGSSSSSNPESSSTTSSEPTSVSTTPSSQESSVESSSEGQPSSSESGNKSGCNGSIVAVSAVSGFSALAGLVIVFSKKKKKE